MTDIVLIFVLVAFSYFGWKKGLIKTLFGLASTVVSLLLSVILYNPVSEFIAKSSFGGLVKENVYKFLSEKGEALLKSDIVVDTASMLVINTVSFIAIIILSKIIVALLSGALNVAEKIPVIKEVNKIIGGAVGIISGLLICYIVIGVLKNLSANETVSQIIKGIENSALAIKFYENNLISDILAKFI